MVRDLGLTSYQHICHTESEPRFKTREAGIESVTHGVVVKPIIHFAAFAPVSCGMHVMWYTCTETFLFSNYSQSCLKGSLHKGVTCIKQPPFWGPLNQNIVQMNLHIRGHLS